MNIGDRVRVLHGTEEGIIKKIIDNKTVEIEIEEGFTFPVLISDLVLIGGHEDKYFTRENPLHVEEKKTDKSELHATIGIYIALELDKGSEKYKLHIINNTDTTLLVAIFRKEKKMTYRGIFHEDVKARKYKQILEVRTSDISRFSELYCQIIQVDPQPGPLRVPVERQIRMSRLLGKEMTKDSPLIGKSAWIKQIDNDQPTQSDPSENQYSVPDKTPSQQIDLHAESLNIREGTPPSEILEEQVRVFNKALDDALIYGHSEITFIHGVGQGVLKERIIREIQSRKDVRYWEEAQKEKFGYGATKIVL